MIALNRGSEKPQGLWPVGSRRLQQMGRKRRHPECEHARGNHGTKGNRDLFWHVESMRWTVGGSGIDTGVSRARKSRDDQAPAQRKARHEAGRIANIDLTRNAHKANRKPLRGLCISAPSPTNGGPV
jgi:hypothetical protein